MPRTKKTATAEKADKAEKKTTKTSVAKSAEKKEVKKQVKKATSAKTPQKSTSKETVKESKKAKTSADTMAENEIALLSKQDIIERFATKNGDTGSPEVQIALSTQKIINLSGHLLQNPKDNHSRRGLLKIIAKRRRILHYLQDKDDSRYVTLIRKLGLKK